MNYKAFLLMALSFPLPAASADEDNASWLNNSREWVQGLWKNEAEQWLGRINPALQSYDYNGVVVFAQGSNMESLLVEHRVHDGKESLRMKTLSGPPKELVKRNGKIQSNVSTQNGTQIAFASGQGTFSRFASAADNKWYKAVLGEKSRVAGRAVQTIDLKADDGYRYSYRLWLDQQSGLPLRVIAMDEKNRIVEQMAFTQIQITPVTGEIKSVVAVKPKALNSPFKEVKGFRLMAKDKIGPSTQYLYSDGLSTYSLYVEPSSIKEKGRMRQGSVNGLMYGNGSVRLVAMGKVPLATLELALTEVSKQN
jgi:sigma-E factor negative regulatory protein RseB